MGIYLFPTDAAWDVFVATGESVVDGFAAVAVNAEQMDFTMPFADPTALVPVRSILMECVFVVGDSQAVSSVYRMAADSTPSGADCTSILPMATVPDSEAYIPARSIERVFVAHPASNVVAQIVASANVFMFCFLSVSSYGLAQTAKRLGTNNKPNFAACARQIHSTIFLSSASVSLLPCQCVHPNRRSAAHST